MGICVAICLFHSPVDESYAGPTRPVRIVLPSGREVSGQLVTRDGEPLLDSDAAAEPLPLSRVQAVHFARSKAVLPPSGPLLRLVFWDGQQLAVRLESIKEDVLHCRIQPGGPVRPVPLALVAAIVGRRDQTLAAYESFEQQSDAWQSDAPFRAQTKIARSGEQVLQLGPQANSARFPCAPPVAAGSVECAVRSDPAAKGPGIIEIIFAQGTVNVAVADGSAAYSASAGDAFPLAVQRVERAPGWHQLKVTFDKSRLRISIDHWLLAEGKRPPGNLQAVRFRWEGGGNAPALWADDLIVYRAAPVPELRREQVAQDAVFLTGGTELFGRVTDCRDQAVTLATPAGAARLRLSQVRALQFAKRVPPTTVDAGLLLQVELQSWEPSARTTLDAPASDLLLGAWRGWNAEHIEIEHAVFGKLKIPLDRVKKLSVLGRQTRVGIDPRVHHLGQRMQPGWRVIAPEGPRLSVPFELKEIPAGKIFLSLGSRELLGTRSRFRGQLLQGNLQTQAFLNGRKVAVLNFHWEPGEERIRIPILADRLKAGENLFELRQTPDQDDPPQYDNCEIDTIRLEIED